MLQCTNIRFPGFALLAIYLAALFITSHERHYHRLPQGEVICHIHPFQQDKSEKEAPHTHSSGDIADQHTNLFDFQENNSDCIIWKSEAAHNRISLPYHSPHFIRTILRNLTLRAPPLT